MNNNGKSNVIYSYGQKNINFDNVPKFIILKKPLLLKSTKISKNCSFDLIFRKNKSNNRRQNSYDKSQKFSNVNKKNKKLTLFPSLSVNNNSCFKTIINSTKNKNIEYNNKKLPKIKIIKLKKIKIKNKNKRYSMLYKKNNYLINLYNEDIEMKKKFDKFKEEKNNNLANFSFQKYNMNLLRLSSINLSQNTYQIFKKNMETIQFEMNGIKIQRKNRWIHFLEKIENFAPECLKKKLLSLSNSKNNNKEEAKTIL